MCSARASLKQWKDSASLILVAKTIAGNRVDVDGPYNLLTLKRSSGSGFLPNVYVFPGGKVDKADNSHEWLTLFKRFGFTIDNFHTLIPKANRSSVVNNEDLKTIQKCLAFRIAAIRETFEECGILMCRKQNNVSFDEGVGQWASFVSSGEILKWQEKVIKDPSQFYTLCLEYEVYPDIWCLYAWSNWATPACSNYKFNTIFYLAALQEMPPTSIDQHEIQELKWATPLEYIIQSKNKKLVLYPPQFYEMSRLHNFPNIKHLLKFANDREKHGIERFLPYRVHTDNGVVSILPGDELYPELNVVEKEDSVYIKSLPETKIQHRIEQHSIQGIRLKM